MSQYKSPLLDTAVLILKGAICEGLGLPCGRTTCSVKYTAPDSFSLTVKSVQYQPSEFEIGHIQNIMTTKIQQDAALAGFYGKRSDLERKYGNAFYDEFGISKDETVVRVVYIPTYVCNSNNHDLLRSSKLIGQARLSAHTYESDKNMLTVTVQCIPTLEQIKKSKSVSPDFLLKVSPQALTYSELPPCAEVLPQTGMEMEDEAEGDLVTPFEVCSVDGRIDYDKLLVKFGCERITPRQLARFETLTGQPPHMYLRRGLFFSHRDLDVILDTVEAGKPFYLYTGRGPSSEALHLGHLVPFMFTAALQKAFKVPLVIQLTDDEKFLHKAGEDPVSFRKLGYENAKSIIACGFDPDRTLIFSDIDYIHRMYPTVLKIQKKVTISQATSIFGFGRSTNVGCLSFPAIQAAPAFSESFPTIFGGHKHVPCLIPMAIDQDPYFRMTRDVAPRLGLLKPSCIHSCFFPSLQGPGGKMSSSDETSAIFCTDTPQQIEHKIMKYAVSGGRATLEEHQKYGADLEKDVPFAYLQFMHPSDERVEEIRTKYSSGHMTTGEVKAELIQVVQKIVREHQEARDAVTDDVVRHFMDPERPYFTTLSRRYTTE